MNYTPTGSGDGIKSISKRMVDFGGSDKPLKPKTLKKKKLYMFPSVVGSIVLAYNFEGVKDGELKLSRAAIDAIFTGKAKFWDDAIITKENAGLKPPHAPITYKIKLGLPAAQIENKEGKFINPTVASSQDAAKYAAWTADNDFYAVIGDPEGATSYPIVAATFILLPQEKTEKNKIMP